MNAIREWLYIGKYAEVQDAALLARYGITAMLHLVEVPAYIGLKTLYLPMDDGVPLDYGALRRGVNFLLEQRSDGGRALAVCGAGMSRSASFALAALKEAENLPLLEAARETKRLHPDAMPHPALWKSLCSYYGERHTFVELLLALKSASAQ